MRCGSGADPSRWLLALGCLLNAYATYEMSTVTLTADYWALAWPRLVQGAGVGFIFVPLNTVALATIPRERMGNTTALLHVVRNLGGAIGVALLTTLLARRSQAHQATLVGHVDMWDTETAARLQAWATHFAAQGADHFTAERRAVSVLYQEVTRQAQLLAFADDTVRESLGELLGGGDVDLRATESGKEALAALGQDRRDLLVVRLDPLVSSPLL